MKVTACGDQLLNLPICSCSTSDTRFDPTANLALVHGSSELEKGPRPKGRPPLSWSRGFLSMGP